MKRILVTISATVVFLLLVTLPAFANHLYPPGRGHGGGTGGGDGDDGGGGGGNLDDVFGGDPGAGGAGGGGDGLADTGGTFKVWMLLVMVSLLVVGIRLLMASRRRKAVFAE